MTVDSDRRQGEHGDVHREHLDERTEGAHEMREVPSLEQSCLKLITHSAVQVASKSAVKKIKQRCGSRIRIDLAPGF